jgi:hypothetical protein
MIEHHQIIWRRSRRFGCSAEPTGDVPTLDFSLSGAQKKELYDFGYSTAKAFFEAEPDGRNTFNAVPASIPGP